MKLEMSMLRSIKVLTEDLLQSCGFDPDKHRSNIQEVDSLKLPKLAKEAFQDKFGPLAPGVQVFWGPLDTMFTTVGVEAMSFTCQQDEPTGGLIDADPMDSSSWHRLDGRLQGELARFGIMVEPSHFEWKFSWRATQ